MKEFNIKNYNTSGCMQVDMCMSAVAWYRLQKRPLKSIGLTKWDFHMFCEYFKNNHWSPEQVEAHEFGGMNPEIDGVEIKCISIILKDGEKMRFEFYPHFRTEENDALYLPTERKELNN